MMNAMTISPKMDNFNNSVRVAKVVQIMSVVLKHLEVVNNMMDYSHKDKKNIKYDIGLHHKTLGYKIFDANVLSVDVEGRLEISTGREGKENPKDLLGTIGIVYEIKYALPKEPIPQEVHGWIKDFADINGIYNAWPYFRARIQDIAADMGFGFTLPTLRVVPKKVGDALQEKNVSEGKGKRNNKLSASRK